MKIIGLKKNQNTYTCNSYLVLGDWNRIEDINTLIDPGIDGFVIREINRTHTGVGKVPVEQIILTHTHFDHSGGVMALKEKFGTKVFAFTPFEGVDQLLKDGQMIRMGENYFTVIHCPTHSSDSICLYNASQKILFSGDVSLNIYPCSEYGTDKFRDLFKTLKSLDIQTIYPGHGPPLTKNEFESAFEGFFKTWF